MTRTVVVCLTLLLVAVPALAHVPEFPDNNTSPDRAVHVDDPLKSWSFYDSLNGEQARYYNLHYSKGEEISVSAFTPGESKFTPSIVLMSPAFEGTEGVPDHVTVPEGMGTVVVEGDRPQSAEYEMFAPSASYRTAEFERPAPANGHYLVAVYDEQKRSGQVGVVVGTREAFTANEYLTVAFDRVRTHLWEGQHPLVVLGPMFGTLVGGMALLRSRQPEDRDWKQTLARYGLGAGALLIVGTGVNTLVQTGIALRKSGFTLAVLVTAFYILLPLLAGGAVFRYVLRDRFLLSTRTRVGLAVAGLVSLATWAGLLLGPAIFFAAALYPRGLLDADVDVTPS
jgi:hypothetical protein